MKNSFEEGYLHTDTLDGGFFDGKADSKKISAEDVYDGEISGENILDEKTSGKDNTGKGKKSLWREAVDLVIYCGVILLATFLIVHFVGQRTEVLGSSMNPTLVNGDQLIVDKISYRFKEPARFDIIVFPAPDEAGKKYIKRIIGLPGEHVQITDGTIYINGQVLEENYGAEVMAYSGMAQDGMTLGADEYFVLGDNRNLSKDSRYDVVGNIHRKDIIGRAWLRMWPLDGFGLLKHQ